MIVVVDEINQIVGSTQKALATPLYYSYGHIKEVSGVLEQYSTTTEYRTQKYPRIVLLQDFAETRGVNVDTEVEVNLQLLIVANSSPQYRAEDRFSKVFKPVLYPIYEAFIKQLYKSRKFQLYTIDDINHEKIDRVAMSDALNEAVKSQGYKNLFNDHLDGIEIRNLRLKFKKNC